MSSRAAIVSPGGAAKFGGAQAPRKLVEHSIDHACLVTLDKSGGHVSIFGHHHPRRHVTAVNQLIGAGPQRCAQNRLDTLEWPAFRQCIVDQGVKITLLTHDAGNDVTEECRLSRKILCALDLVAYPVALKFSQDFVQPGASHIHLIKRLNRREPGRAALVRLARVLVIASGAEAHQRHTSVCLSATIVSAARAAAPPLSPSSTRARAWACASLSTVRIPLPMASRSFTARSIRARADSFDTISKW